MFELFNDTTELTAEWILTLNKEHANDYGIRSK